MAQEVFSANYSSPETYQFINENLRNDFSVLWEMLPKASQVDLVSGCLVYCDLYALGNIICDEIDFSAAIIPIIKAAEVVFRKYLCHDYLDYLLNRGISPDYFPSSYPLIEYDTHLKKYRFRSKDSVVFTLGSIKHLVIDHYKREVYPVFLSYARTLMGTNLESNHVLQDYLMRLSHKMTQFTFDIRNPAAHSAIMPMWQAEICGNEIILVKKILKDFMSRISHENN